METIGSVPETQPLIHPLHAEPDMKAAALDLAAKGFQVFPCNYPIDGHCSCGRADCGSAGKHPASTHGCLDATSDLERIRAMWSRPYNIGLNTAGLLVVDIDPRHGGAEHWQELCDELSLGPVETLTCRTGGGGWHHYFHAPDGFRAPAHLAPGVDLKSQGGYVIAPPSLHMSGKPYTWENPEAMIGAFPEALFHPIEQMAQNPRPAAAIGADALILEGGRNSHLTSLAGSMRRRGMDQSAILAALLEENKLRCKPPLPQAEVRQIAESVGKYAPAPAIQAAARVRLTIRSMDAAFDDPDVVADPLITGLLYPGLTMLHGAPKAGKTFLAIQIAKAVLTGESLGDYFSVNYAGPVLYLSEMSEAQLRVRTKRIGLTREQHQSLYFVDVHEMLPWTGGGAEQLEATLAAMERKPLLLIADSLLGIIKATQKSGNIAVQEYAMVARFKSIADTSHLPTLLLHHSRKMVGNPIESAMGTGGTTAGADDIWALKREPGHEAILTCEGRACETRTYRFKQNVDGFWEIVDWGPGAILGPVRRQVLDLIRINPHLHGREIAEKLDMNEKTVQTHLLRLADAGVIRNGKQGYMAVASGPR